MRQSVFRSLPPPPPPKNGNPKQRFDCAGGVLPVVMAAALLGLYGIVVFSHQTATTRTTPSSDAMMNDNKNGLVVGDPYATTPMCNADGVCGEDPTIPSPRTVYSAKSRDQYELWIQYQAKLRRDAQQFRRNDDAAGSNKPSLIFYGDSITESWQGTNMGVPDARCAGIPHVFAKRFARQYNTAVFAIGGDQTQHLLHRLQRSELVLPDMDDATFVVLIGTNNIGSGILPEPTARGILAVVKYLLHETTRSRVILLDLLPRGDGWKLEKLCPPRCHKKDGRPFESFLPAIHKANQQVREKLEDSRVNVIDCGRAFYETETDINATLMPDLLHPNAAGHELLATCILDCLQGRTCA